MLDNPLRRLKRRVSFVTVLLLVAGGYFVLCLLTWLFQDKLIFFPWRDYIATPAQYSVLFDEAALATQSGDTVAVWYCRTRSLQDAGGVILFLNGNAGNMSHRLERLAMAKRVNCDILLVDYPGYGKSSGSPNEVSLYAAADAAYDYLVGRHGVFANKIVVYGESIGSAAAVHLAVSKKIGGLVCEAPFTSLPNVGQAHFPYLPVRYLLKYRFPIMAEIPNITCPVLIAHSPDDEVTPFRMGEEVFGVAREPKRFVKLSGGHNDRDFLDNPEWQASFSWLVDKAIGDKSAESH